MLRAESLACQRGERSLFAALDFSLAPGSLLRVRGANGSGKTSLLRILAGLTRPAAGAVRWRGEPIETLDDGYRREMLFIGHAAGVKDDMTAAENLDFSCRLSGLTISATQITGALDELGIARLAQLPARFLSQGQRRRTALARLALAASIPLWLLDEPFAALDEDGIARVAALCGAQLAAGGIVVLTSHQEVAVEAAAAALELRL